MLGSIVRKFLDQPALELSMMFMFFLSLIVYIILLITIVRYRTIDPFNSSFFIIVQSIGVIDIVSLVHTFILRKLPQLGIFTQSFFIPFCGCDKVVNGSLGMYYYGTLPKWTVVTQIAVLGCQAVGVLIMAANRFSALARPFTFHIVWSRKRTLLMIALQVIFGVVCSAPLWGTKDQMLYVATKDPHNVTKASVYLRKTVSPILTAQSCLMILIATTSTCLYGAAFRDLSKQAAQSQTNHSRSQQANSSAEYRRMEGKLALCGVVSLAIQLYLVICQGAIFLTAVDREGKDFLARLLALAWDVFGWHNPYVLLMISGKVRKYFWKTLCYRKN